jgi:hypothetical protein
MRQRELGTLEKMAAKSWLSRLMGEGGRAGVLGSG